MIILTHERKFYNIMNIKKGECVKQSPCKFYNILGLKLILCAFTLLRKLNSMGKQSFDEYHEEQRTDRHCNRQKGAKANSRNFLFLAAA